ncbi:MAG: extracellular solute-binding protein [Christensenellales bacterium]|jgi:putative aldouronate transport system substrate-binding protein
MFRLGFRILSLALTLMLIFTSFSLAESNFNAPGEFPICIESEEITIGVVANANVIDYVDNDFTRWLEEKGNIKINFEFFSPSDARQKLEIIINSGSKLPDVLAGFELSEIAIQRYGSQGIFVPVNDYIDTIGVGMQDAFNRVAAKNFREMITSPDGNIYYMPRFNEQVGNMWQLRSWINKQWLDNLGLEIPTTTDELYEVLKAFAEKDPNGNGINDEVPLVGATGNKQQAADYLMNAFIYDDMMSRWIVENDVLDVPYNKDEWREGLRYISKLCTEGLFSPLTFTMDNSQLKQLLASGIDRNVVGVFTSNSFNVTPVDERRLEYVSLPPLTGPQGVCWAAYFPTIPTSRWIITKDAANPELAYRIGDLMVTREASMFGRWGKPGIDWREPTADDKSLLESLGFNPTVVPILEFGVPQKSHWFMTHCFVLELGLNDGQSFNDDDPLYSERWVAQALPLYIDKAPKELVEQIKYTPEESEQIQEIMSTLKTFVEESMARFITGDMDIERDWDDYVKELDNIGLTKYIEVSQTAYLRTIGK